MLSKTHQEVYFSDLLVDSKSSHISSDVIDYGLEGKDIIS